MLFSRLKIDSDRYKKYWSQKYFIDFESLKTLCMISVDADEAAVLGAKMRILRPKVTHMIIKDAARVSYNYRLFA